MSSEASQLRELAAAATAKATNAALATNAANAANALAAAPDSRENTAILRAYQRARKQGPSTVVETFANAGAQAAATRVIGHWYVDAEEEGFLFDRNMAELFGHEDYHQWFPATKIVSMLSSFDAARFWLNIKQRIMGDMIYERVTFNNGPLSGQCFIIQGSIMSRAENGTALYATGYISHESSPYSEFIPREISGDGMYLWNAATDELITSASYHAMLGMTDAEFPHTYTNFVEDLVHPDDNDIMLVQQQVVTTTLYGDYFESCLRLRHKDGHYLWTIARGLVLSRNENNIATQIIGTQTNINLVQNNFDNIKLMMFTDSLTGLHNRNYFQQHALRYDDPKLAPVSIIFVDVTGLKVTNDILGHSYGDYLIIKTCDIIRTAIHEVVSENLAKCPKPYAKAKAKAKAKADTAGAAGVDGSDDTSTTNDADTACECKTCSYTQEAVEELMAKAALDEAVKKGHIVGSGTIAAQKSGAGQRQETARAMGINTKRTVAATSALESVATAAGKSELEVKVDAQMQQVQQEPQPELQAPQNAASTAAATADTVNNAATATTATKHQACAPQSPQMVEKLILDSGLEIMRLAGDEFLVIYPNCDQELAQAVAARIKRIRDTHNSFHEHHTSIDERPVPVFFGVGVATFGDDESVTNDDLKQVIDRADKRMQENKDSHRLENYSYLKKYFELKMGRPVSMRDDRRLTILSEKEREEIREHRISNIIL